MHCFELESKRFHCRNFTYYLFPQAHDQKWKSILIPKAKKQKLLDSVNFVIASAILLPNADFITNLHYSWSQMGLKVLTIFFLA